MRTTQEHNNCAVMWGSTHTSTGGKKPHHVPNKVWQKHDAVWAATSWQYLLLTQHSLFEGRVHILQKSDARGFAFGCYINVTGCCKTTPEAMCWEETVNRQCRTSLNWFYKCGASPRQLMLCKVAPTKDLPTCELAKPQVRHFTSEQTLHVWLRSEKKKATWRLRSHHRSKNLTEVPLLIMTYIQRRYRKPHDDILQRKQTLNWSCYFGNRFSSNLPWIIRLYISVVPPSCILPDKLPVKRSQHLNDLTGLKTVTSSVSQMHLSQEFMTMKKRESNLPYC